MRKEWPRAGNDDRAARRTPRPWRVAVAAAKLEAVEGLKETEGMAMPSPSPAEPGPGGEDLV
jgi:hypothetical protein